MLTAEQRDNLTAVMGCSICGAGAEDSHWSNCPYAPESATSDDDPDADESLRSLEIL